MRKVPREWVRDPELGLVLLGELNDEQRAVASLPIDAAARVVAGAGTGKTTVIAARFAYLCHRYGLAPHRDLVAVTFTEKAASEMADRIRATLQRNGMPADLGLRVHTFHGFCRRVLEEYPYDARPMPGFKVLEGRAARELEDRVCRELVNGDLRDAEGRAITPQRLLRFGENNARWVAGGILRVVASARNLGWEPGEIATRQRAAPEVLRRLLDEPDPPITQDQLNLLAGDTRELHDLARICDAAHERYSALCQAEGVLDFSGLILETVRLLGGHDRGGVTTVGESVRNSFRALMVDEFQDTNKLQLDLIRALVGDGSGRVQRVTVVGDRKQGIYEWRDARIENIDDVIPPGAGWAVACPLSRNYRSSERVVRIANRAAERVVGGTGEALVAAAGVTGPSRVFVVEPPEGAPVAEQRQAAYPQVAQAVRALRDDPQHPVQYRDMAVLIRKNGMFAGLASAFDGLNIPYLRVGGLGLLDQPLAKDIVAALDLVRDARRSISLARLLLRPPVCLTHRDLYLLCTRPGDVEGYDSDEDTTPRRRPVPLLERVAEALLPGERRDALVHDIGEERVGAVGRLLETVIALQAESKVLSLRALVDAIVERLEVLRRAAKRELVAWPFVRDTLRGVIASVESAGEHVGVRDLLEALGESADLPAPDFGDPNGVRIMTAHKAKGLEFEAVFLLGIGSATTKVQAGVELDEMLGVVPTKASGLAAYDIRRALSARRQPEEDRLWYVGITRAKRHLGVFRERPARRKEGDEETPAWLTDLAAGGDTDPLPQLDAPDASHAASPPRFPPPPHPNRAHRERVVTLSASELGDLATCPVRWWMARKWLLGGAALAAAAERDEALGGVRAGRVAEPMREIGGAELGIAVHAAAARLASGEDPMGPEVPREAGPWVEALRSAWPDLVGGYERGESERRVQFSVPIGDGLGIATVVGRADWIGYTDGGATVFDWKTDDPRRTGRELTYALQLVAYERALADEGVPPSGDPVLAYIQPDAVKLIPLPYRQARELLPDLCRLAVEYEVAGAVPPALSDAPCATCEMEAVCPRRVPSGSPIHRPLG